MGVKAKFGAAIWAGLAILTSVALGQANEQSSSLLKRSAVEYLYPEQITLPAGQLSPVALHFRIAPGLHINSHSPKDEFLIPTTLTIPDDSSVHLVKVSYPPGTDFTLPADPSIRLNVYTGEFVIDTHLVAAKGDHLVEARLRYQACDQNACMPPKTVTAALDVIAK